MSCAVSQKEFRVLLGLHRVLKCRKVTVAAQRGSMCGALVWNMAKCFI